MKSIVSLQKKLIMFFVLVALALLGAGYYYLNAMKTTQGKLNINKITKVNKLYSYDVYSDFYFSVKKYDENGNKVSEYSELQPIKTSIGYNLENNSTKPILQSTLEDKKICISENNAESLKKYTDMMREFEKTFGKIVATQDKSYFESSYKSTQEILRRLYNIELSTKVDVDNYYTEVKDLPIGNMKMKYFKLDKIPKNQREEMNVAPNKKGEWQPNIAEWTFGEKDKIYLQYFMKWEKHNLDDFISKKAKNKTVIKLVKMNNNKLQTMYFMKYDKQPNKLDTLFMDENGYVYILTFDATNDTSFKKYISDYLKIVYGLYFVDTPNFKNWFVEEQSFSDVYVSFGVHERDMNLNEIVQATSMFSVIGVTGIDNIGFDKGALGFECNSENEIILNINQYTYHFDENEKDCIMDKSKAILTWNKTSNIYIPNKYYKVGVIEEDIGRNDKYEGKSIFFTLKDIENIKNGIAVKKDIGSNYFVIFKK